MNYCKKESYPISDYYCTIVYNLIGMKGYETCDYMEESVGFYKRCIHNDPKPFCCNEKAHLAYEMAS